MLTLIINSKYMEYNMINMLNWEATLFISPHYFLPHDFKSEIGLQSPRNGDTYSKTISGASCITYKVGISHASTKQFHRKQRT
jgi:hypothetical protein